MKRFRFSSSLPLLIALFCLGLLFLPGCAPLDHPIDILQDRHDRVTVPLAGEHTAGQTFIARQPDLSAVEVLLAVQAAGEQSRPASTIVFHLRSSPDATTDLATVVVDTTPIQQEAVLHFDFPPRPDSAGKSYYFFLSGTPSNPDGIQYASLDVYEDGTRFTDHQAAEGDLWFTTIYTYGPARAVGEIVQGLIGHGGTPLTIFLVCLGLLFLPGSALLILTGYGPDTRPAQLDPSPLNTLEAAGQSHTEGAAGSQPCLDGLDWLALAFGLSLAVAPLLILWTSTIGLRLGPGWMLAFLACAAVVVVFGLVKNRARLRKALTLHSLAWGALFTLLFVAILAVRFIQIRQVALPLWVDSLHHTMIARLIAEGGRLPSSYRPFMPVDDFYYQYGFHTVAAYFQWLSGLDMSQVVLIVGQVLNAGAALSAYLLAVRLTRRRLVGLCAVLITGLISTMPAYYVSWGRYTQLAGMAILPTALVLTVECVEAFQALDFRSAVRPPPSCRTVLSTRSFGYWINRFTLYFEFLSSSRQLWRRLLLAALSLAGLFLTHYRVLFFAACFFVVYIASAVWRQRRDKARLVRLGAGWFSVGGIALLLALPWLVHLIRVSAVPSETIARAVTRTSQNVIPLDYILTGFDRALIALSVGGCLWALLRRERGVLLMLAWIVFVLVAVNPSALGLPTIWLTNNASTLIILYLPFSIAVGYLVTTLYEYADGYVGGYADGYVGGYADGYVGGYADGYVDEALGARWRRPLQIGTGAVLLVVACLGIWQQIPIVNPSTILAEAEDVQAMEWIRDNTPPSAVFLINTRLWTGKIYMGSDGGWWIPLLTDRQTTLPPALYSIAPRAYIQRINALAEAVSKADSLDEASVRDLLRDWGVTHVYIGARGGKLTPWMLAGSPYYKPVYTHGAVWIFQVE